MDFSKYLFSTADQNLDLIHVRHSCSTLDGNNDLRIDSDDGNESSYGFDIWRLDIPGIAILIESSGRDCFEGNISDALIGQFWGDSGVIEIDVFEAELKKHIKKWS